MQNILDRTNVGRSMFYAHFRDKEELLLSGFYELEYDLHAHIREDIEAQKETGTLSCLSLFHHAESNYRTPAQMDEMFRQIAMPGVRAVLGMPAG